MDGDGIGATLTAMLGMLGDAAFVLAPRGRADGLMRGAEGAGHTLSLYRAFGGALLVDGANSWATTRCRYSSLSWR